MKHWVTKYVSLNIIGNEEEYQEIVEEPDDEQLAWLKLPTVTDAHRNLKSGITNAKVAAELGNGLSMNYRIP